MRRYWVTLFAVLLSIPGVIRAQDEPLPIIDAHTHTSFTGGTEPTTGRPRTIDEYFKEWRERELWAPWPTRPRTEEISTTSRVAM